MSSRIDWTFAETGALISLWQQDHIQKMFNSMCRKKPIWEDISKQLKIKGIDRTGKQCEVRIHTMTTKYRKIVKANKESGASPKFCPFFEQLDEVLGTKASTAPPCLIDSGIKTSVPEMVDDNNNEVPCEMNAGSVTVVDKNDNETDCQKTEISPEKNTTTQAQDDKGNTVSNPRSNNDDRKSRKRSNTEDLMTSFLEMQQKSEERFFEFEKKRMEMEAKEEENRQKREEEQEKKQQDFLLELAKIFAAKK
ncbi:uncharacterized protein [Mytilus edulis]|uniref:Myb-like domain-containing protein n=2 Tax=Mytilus TaxID=6548 RepID=A0A8B6EGN6_MYTGA|nr:Hypothetical predicted protein [Mytilus galloprovincialis]